MNLAVQRADETRGESIINWENASDPEQTAIAERTQARKLYFKHKGLADPVPKHLCGYESRQRSGDRSVLAEFKQSSRLTPAVRNDEFEDCISSVMAVVRFAFIEKEHGADLLSTVQKSIFLRDVV